jgi:hypothetical protein
MKNTVKFTKNTEDESFNVLVDGEQRGWIRPAREGIKRVYHLHDMANRAVEMPPIPTQADFLRAIHKTLDEGILPTTDDCVKYVTEQKQAEAAAHKQQLDETYARFVSQFTMQLRTALESTVQHGVMPDKLRDAALLILTATSRERFDTLIAGMQGHA